MVFSSADRHSVGDTKVPFCLQSCVKPLEYAIAVNDLGSELTHQFVGKEPSGLRFNKLSLNEDGKSLALSWRDGRFTPLYYIASTFVPTARSHLSHSGLCGAFRLFGDAAWTSRHSVYLFNRGLLLQCLWAASDNMCLLLVQISHTTQW